MEIVIGILIGIGVVATLLYLFVIYKIFSFLLGINTKFWLDMFKIPRKKNIDS